MSGGYDDGYRTCGCFWGKDPSSLVKRLGEWLPPIKGLRVLDAGCGEGKNAAFLAAAGATVDAFDVSPAAIANAMSSFPGLTGVTFSVADARTVDLPREGYDVAILYGLLHCLPDAPAVRTVLSRVRAATRVGGVHLVCAFNDRSQDLSAHPGFNPILLSHEWYLAEYADWQTVEATRRSRG
jgi:SAM-dependent methyltransferase